MPGPRIIIAGDEPSLGERGAELVCSVLERAIAERGRAHLALTGGGTAIILYRALGGAAFRDRVDWRRVDLWWGDDRFVPFDHPESNVNLVRDTLLAMPLTVAPVKRETVAAARLGAARTGGLLRENVEPPEGIVIPAENVHPFPIPEAEAARQGPDWCAARYAEQLTAALPLNDQGLPIFDLVLLGVGPDGHLLSVFPGSPLVDAPAPPICVGVPAPTHVTPHLPRVTCSPRLSEVARDVLVMVSGPAKAQVMREVLAGPRDPHRYPSQLAARPGATWMLDAAAAVALPDELRRPEG